MAPHHTSSVWDPHLLGSHINVLELQAVFNAHHHFHPFVNSKHLFVQTAQR